MVDASRKMARWVTAISDVIGVGGDHLGCCGAVADEEIEDARRDDGTLGETRVDDLVWGCSGEIEAGSFPIAKVGK